MEKVAQELKVKMEVAQDLLNCTVEHVERKQEELLKLIADANRLETQVAQYAAAIEKLRS